MVGLLPERLSERPTGLSSSPTRKAHPDFGWSEFDESKVVFAVLFEAGGDGTEVLEFAEEAFDEVAVAIEEGAERRAAFAAGHRLDVGPCAARGHLEAQGITVVGAIGEQHVAAAERIEHVGGAPAIVCLSGRQLERDRQAARIDQRVDLGGQSTARAPHASVVRLTPRGRYPARPLFTVGTMLVNPDRRAVDHLHIAIISP